MRSAAVSARAHVDLPERIRSRRKFLRFFPKGFYDQKYWAWERGYKWTAHERWLELLPKSKFNSFLTEKAYSEIGSRALRTLSGTNLLFSFENMALRDALKDDLGAKVFAKALFDFIYGSGRMEQRFNEWCSAIASLPKIQSRVLTHPVTTVFGFIANPKRHIFLKPVVTKRAAAIYGFDLRYTSKPGWETYSSVLEFADMLAHDLADLEPRDMIDIQSFLWVQGSDEY
jgi:hypothetical protein